MIMCTQMSWCLAEPGLTFLDMIFEIGIGFPQAFKQMFQGIFVRIQRETEILLVGQSMYWGEGEKIKYTATLK